MKPLLLAALIAQIAQVDGFTFERRTFRTPDGGTMRYGIAIPATETAGKPRPLVLALHPGGGTAQPYYGDGFMRSVFLPPLRSLDPVMIAPDVPARAWTEPLSEQAVLALVQSTLSEHAIDRDRILVMGFSLGGAGTWFMSSRHPEVFTGAIVMAGRTDEPVERLGRIPTYIIHSRNDQVVPFGQAQYRALALENLKRPVVFELLRGVGHHEMGGYTEALERAGKWIAEQWAVKR
jgi:predicted peptidase